MRLGSTAQVCFAAQLRKACAVWVYSRTAQQPCSMYISRERQQDPLIQSTPSVSTVTTVTIATTAEHLLSALCLCLQSRAVLTSQTYMAEWSNAPGFAMLLKHLTSTFLPLKSPRTSRGNCRPATLILAPCVRDTSCFLTSARTLLPSALWISTASRMDSSLLVRVATGCPFLSQSTFLCAGNHSG